MRYLVKYILPLLFLALSWSAGDEILPVSDTNINESDHTEWVIDETLMTDPLSQPYLTRTTSSVNFQNIQNGTRRGENGNRHNITYLKAGKIVHTGLCLDIHNNYTLIHSVLSEPSHKLIRCRKLII